MSDHIIIFETKYWTAFMAETQFYPGRLYIQLKRSCVSLSNMKNEEWNDFQKVVEHVEKSYSNLGATMFNWTCMMNDEYKHDPPKPQVHWHFRPRFKKPITIDEFTFQDPNFGHHYRRADERASKTPRKDVEKIAAIVKRYL